MKDPPTGSNQHAKAHCHESTSKTPENPNVTTGPPSNFICGAQKVIMFVRGWPAKVLTVSIQEDVCPLLLLVAEHLLSSDGQSTNLDVSFGFSLPAPNLLPGQSKPQLRRVANQRHCELGESRAFGVGYLSNPVDRRYFHR